MKTCICFLGLDVTPMGLVTRHEWHYHYNVDRLTICSFLFRERRTVVQAGDGGLVSEWGWEGSSILLDGMPNVCWFWSGSSSLGNERKVIVLFWERCHSCLTKRVWFGCCNRRKLKSLNSDLGCVTRLLLIRGRNWWVERFSRTCWRGGWYVTCVEES